MSATANVKLHRDGTVTLWDVHTQSWSRGAPSNRNLASMDAATRSRVERHVVRVANRTRLNPLPLPPLVHA